MKNKIIIHNDTFNAVSGRYERSNYLDITVDYPIDPPRKPTEDDGYFPSKKLIDIRIKNPNDDQGYGWSDKKGNVWVPIKPDHYDAYRWSVQFIEGNSEIVMPGGKIKGIHE